MNKLLKKRIFVAGHKGMVGRAICRNLPNSIDIITRSKEELDLTNQSNVIDFFHSEKPDEVIIASAKVGGIFANSTYPGQFIYENLQMQNNLIHSAHLTDVSKLLFLGSSCIYPKLAKQPMKEDELLKDVLEPTNEPYAIAKIAGIKLCESYNRQYGRDYRSVMPTNLYGPGDNYHPLNSHVVPALIRRFHEAKNTNQIETTVWGSGNVKREFLFVDDMAKACIFIHNLDYDYYSKNTSKMLSHINIGTGEDITIRQLAEKIKTVVGFQGDIKFDSTKPDGSPRKLLDVSLIKKLGWNAKVDLDEGLRISYNDFLRENRNI